MRKTNVRVCKLPRLTDSSPICPVKLCLLWAEWQAHSSSNVCPLINYNAVIRNVIHTLEAKQCIAFCILHFVCSAFPPNLGCLVPWPDGVNDTVQYYIVEELLGVLVLSLCILAIHFSCFAFLAGVWWNWRVTPRAASAGARLQFFVKDIYMSLLPSADAGNI